MEKEKAMDTINKILNPIDLTTNIKNNEPKYIPIKNLEYCFSKICNYIFNNVVSFAKCRECHGFINSYSDDIHISYSAPLERMQAIREEEAKKLLKEKEIYQNPIQCTMVGTPGDYFELRTCSISYRVIGEYRKQLVKSSEYHSELTAQQDTIEYGLRQIFKMDNNVYMQPYKTIITHPDENEYYDFDLCEIAYKSSLQDLEKMKEILLERLKEENFSNYTVKICKASECVGIQTTQKIGLFKKAISFSPTKSEGYLIYFNIKW